MIFSDLQIFTIKKRIFPLLVVVLKLLF